MAKLSDYGSTNFTNLAASGTGGSAALHPIYMVSQSGTIISYPADLNAAADLLFAVLRLSQPASRARQPYSSPPPVTLPSITSHGYWLVGSDGGVFAFGSAQFYGSIGSLHLLRPVVDIVATADKNGYWLGASDGGIFAFGDATFHGSIPGLGLRPAGSGAPELPQFSHRGHGPDSQTGTAI